MRVRPQPSRHSRTPTRHSRNPSVIPATPPSFPQPLRHSRVGGNPSSLFPPSRRKAKMRVNPPQGKEKMQTRKLGPLTVPVIGMGTASSSGFNVESHAEIQNCRRILDDCLTAGATFLDTSPMYRRAEAVIGQGIRGRRHKFQLATKVYCAGVEAGRAPDPTLLRPPRHRPHRSPSNPQPRRLAHPLHLPRTSQGRGQNRRHRHHPLPSALLRGVGPRYAKRPDRRHPDTL